MGMPRVIMHNSVSLDGAVNGFDVDMGLHYQIAGEYRAEAHLVGSNTVKVGVALYGAEIPPEEKSDYVKPEKSPGLPLWVIPDTRGTLMGMLHYLRRMEYCSDVLVLVATDTSREYIQYLEARDYDYYLCGEKHADYRQALAMLGEKYGVKTVMVDAGPILNGILLANGLIDEIHLLVAPCLVGGESARMFSGLGPMDRILAFH
jgi:2,5-diamino-6-(ribosylamino)-4(3H)-pyrimidinone 5'-phosphate reductase